jgi:hypothetical protein
MVFFFQITSIDKDTCELDDKFTIDCTMNVSGNFTVLAVFHHKHWTEDGNIGRFNKVFQLNRTASAPISTYTRTFFGWEIGVCDKIQVTLVAVKERDAGGSEGDEASLYAGYPTTGFSVTEPSSPFQPIIEYILNWLETEPTLSGYAKVFQELRKPFRFITTRPQFFVYTPDGPFKWWTAHDNQIEYRSMFIVAFLDDIRGKVDFSRHETFVRKFSDHIRLNPTLGGTLGVLNAELVSYSMPGQSTESTFLHQSSVRISINVLPEYV